MLASSRDGDPSTVDVRGTTGRHHGGVATAGIIVNVIGMAAEPPSFEYVS